MTVREILGFLAEQYDTEVSPEFAGDSWCSVFPAAKLQTCIVHLMRDNLNYASWKDRKALAPPRLRDA